MIGDTRETETRRSERAWRGRQSCPEGVGGRPEEAAPGVRTNRAVLKDIFSVHCLVCDETEMSVCLSVLSKRPHLRFQAPGRPQSGHWGSDQVDSRGPPAPAFPSWAGRTCQRVFSAGRLLAPAPLRASGTTEGFCVRCFELLRKEKGLKTPHRPCFPQMTALTYEPSDT